MSASNEKNRICTVAVSRIVRPDGYVDVVEDAVSREEIGRLKQRIGRLRRQVEEMRGFEPSYDALTDPPAINGHALSAGENSLEALRIGRASMADINNIFRQ